MANCDAFQDDVSTKDERAMLCTDGSIQFLGVNPSWSEPTLFFRWPTPQRIAGVRLEFLPNLLDPDQGIRRRKGELVLYDVWIERFDGKKWRELYPSYVWNPADEKDETISGASDFASDTGWVVDDAKKVGKKVVMLFQFSKLIDTSPTNLLRIKIDSGGADTLSAIARTRVSFARAK